MALTIRFIFKSGYDLRMGQIEEIQGSENIRNWLKTHVYDKVQLGIAPGERFYRVLKVSRRSDGDDFHMNITVTEILESSGDQSQNIADPDEFNSAQ